MAEEKKEVLENIFDEKSEDVVGGEVQEYKSWLKKRYKITNNISGKVAKSGFKDYDEAVAADKRLNSDINSKIYIKK